MEGGISGFGQLSDNTGFSLSLIGRTSNASTLLLDRSNLIVSEKANLIPAFASQLLMRFPLASFHFFLSVAKYFKPFHRVCA